MNKLDIIAALEQEEVSLHEKIKSLRQTILTLKQSIAIEDSQTNGSNNIVTSRLGVKPPSVKPPTALDSTKYPGFYTAKSWREKVRIVFKSENRFLHYREIIDIIIGLYPDQTKETLKNSISPALSFLKNEGVIVKKKEGESNINSFWGSKNWLNPDGSIKPEHMYDKSQVTTGGSSKDYEF
ncbi:MAG: hypothetical protein K0Q79_3349 [Flavipsychrobacter sp.]|jgi:hypothetical protein|nr:hypothetical protein [Flavipsychrobacter sp.]